MSKHIISASEMERYGYCPLSWHLDLKGIDAEGEEVTSGVEKHREIGTSLTNLLVEEKKSRETSSTLLTVVGMIMAVALPILVAFVVGSAIFRLRVSGVYVAIITLALSLIHI